jgi:hypothetical protein
MTGIGKPRHPHAEATYRILSRLGMEYAVEVSIPGMNPTIVSGFATEEQAVSWVAGHRERVMSGPLLQRWRRPSSAVNGGGGVAKTGVGKSI